MQNYLPFHLPSMLAATANGGPTTYVAINGMLSTTPTGHHVANPGSMLTMPSALTPSGLLPGSNMGPNPFLFPSTTFPHLSGGNLVCAAGPFPSSPFHTPLLPFFTSTAAGVLAGNPPISAPSPFSAPLPQQLLQPQHTGPSLNTFPSAVSVTSVMGQLGSQPHLLSDPNQMTINTISPSLLPNALPQHSMLLSTPSLNIGSSLASNSSDILTYAPPSVSCVSTSGTNIPIMSNCTYSANTIASSAGSMHTALSSPIQLPISPPSTPQSSSPPGSSGSGPTYINSSLQSSLKLDKFQPVVSNGTLGHRSTHPTTLLSLESVDFHRDEILDAIDKLRERKARPDFERISCMLKRHRNINPEQTQLCLGKLAAAGAVVCVDYKGNLSYRNPSKWRKTAVTSGVTNPASISQRLIEALRRLMAGTVYQPNCVPGSEQTFASLLPAPPGPNGGYSLFQIERALQVVDSSVPKTTTTGGLSSKPLPELTGATLRVCLDREAVHGKLAKTPDGRYVLDESGERKRLASLAALSNKKPLPPHSLSSNFLSTPGSHSKYVKPSGSVAPIAPAGEQATRPLAAKQPQPGTVSIAPVGSRTISPSPLFNLPPRPSGISRRGRPPGSKSRRCLPNADCVTLSEKKLKLETATGSFSTDSASQTHSIPTSPFGQNTTIANPATLKASVPHPVISVSQNGFCSSNSFIGLTPVNGVCSTVLPTPILPSSFPVSQAPDATLSHAFNSPFFTFSTCPTPVVSCPNGFQHPGILPNLPATMPCDFSVLSKQDSSHESTLITVLPNLDPTTWNQMNEEKCEKEVEGLCYHCGTQAVKDEPFLICKDCNLHAHPICLDYWPELTERARQSPWQCADCKTCSACQNRQFTTELLICDACDKGFHSECHEPKLQEPVDRSLPWVCAECQKEGYSVAIGTLPDSMTIPTSSSVNEDSITTATDEVDNKGNQEIENETSMLLEEASSIGNMTLTKEDDEIRPSLPTPHTTSSHTLESDLVRAPSVEHSEPASQPGLNPVVQNPSSVQLQSPHSLSTAEPADSNPYPSNSEATPVAKPVTTTHSPNVNQSNINFVQRNSSLSAPNRPWEADVCSPVACTPTIVRSTSNSTVDESQDTNGHDNAVCHNLHGPAETVDTNHSHGVPEHLLRPDDVRAWSVDHVRDWLLEEGFSREAEAFSQQEIDGACLLLMKRMDVLTELGIKLGPAVKIYERIKRLQSRCTSPTVLGV